MVVGDILFSIRELQKKTKSYREEDHYAIPVPTIPVGLIVRTEIPDVSLTCCNKDQQELLNLKRFFIEKYIFQMQLFTVTL